MRVALEYLWSHDLATHWSSVLCELGDVGVRPLRCGWQTYNLGSIPDEDVSIGKPSCYHTLLHKSRQCISWIPVSL